MSAEEKQKQEWIEQYVDTVLGRIGIAEPTLTVLTGAYMVADAAWLKYCDDGPGEIDNRDLGVWDLARCDGGVR